jgi:hypothetical protein
MINSSGTLVGVNIDVCSKSDTNNMNSIYVPFKELTSRNVCLDSKYCENMHAVSIPKK